MDERYATRALASQGNRARCADGCSATVAIARSSRPPSMFGCACPRKGRRYPFARRAGRSPVRPTGRSWRSRSWRRVGQRPLRAWDLLGALCGFAAGCGWRPAGMRNGEAIVSRRPAARQTRRLSGRRQRGRRPAGCALVNRALPPLRRRRGAGAAFGRSCRERAPLCVRRCKPACVAGDARSRFEGDAGAEVNHQPCEPAASGA
jgi:hypothetical protein